MKRASLKLMRLAGVFSLLRLLNRSRVLILTYHRFGDGSEATSARAFEEQLRFLAAHYHLVPLSRIAECLANGEPFPPAAAAITIDDGYADAYEVAFPILRRYGAPATIFAVTDFLDGRAWVWTDKMRFLTSRAQAVEIDLTLKGRATKLRLGDPASRHAAATRVNSLLKRLPENEKDEVIAHVASALGVELPERPPREFSPVTWDEAREMDGAGVRVESHTVTHPILTKCGDGRLRQELTSSRARLEEVLGRKIELFCYPNGNHDERVLREAVRAGYSCAVTVEHGFADRRSDPLALPRVHTESDFTRFLQRTSGFEEVKNRLRGAKAAEAFENHHR